MLNALPDRVTVSSFHLPTSAWFVFSFVEADSFRAPRPRPIHRWEVESADQTPVYLPQYTRPSHRSLGSSATGYSIELFADEAESYYANLSGNHPGVFVVCEQEEDDELRPLLTTLSYDEMASYIEVDTPVFDLPIPPPIYEWVEAWVLENYQPQQKKKRTRQKWADESWKPLRDPVGR